MPSIKRFGILKMLEHHPETPIPAGLGQQSKKRGNSIRNASISRNWLQSR